MSLYDVDVAVVGGGISGLTAALVIADNSAASIALLEAGSALGGNIRTERVGDVEVEAGADSFLARSPEGPSLARSLGLDDDLIEPNVFGALVAYDKGRARLPGGSVYGIPGSVRSLLASSALSPVARLRALSEVLTPRKLGGRDVSVGDFVTRRFGRQVLDRLVDPLLAGTRAGDVRDMSLAAALPQVDALARRHRSLLLGIGSERRRGSIQTGTPPFLKIRSGMSKLIETLGNRLAQRVELRLDHPVERLQPSNGGVVLESLEDIRARAVIFAAPAYAASSAVESWDEDAAELLGRIGYASVASVALVYRPESIALPPDVSGLLMGRGAARAVSAITFYSQKWGLPIEDGAVLRCFVGRADRHPALDLSDSELVSKVTSDLGSLVDVSGDPVGSNVVRWERSLPQYSVGHLDRLAVIESRLRARGPIFLAGAGYRGSGIPDCIRQGQTAANRVLSLLSTGVDGGADLL
ncbi:MAG: protoporphyrinogen oxidase [Actinomycetota bacterium]|nr:protoporphyrinogen oxidase [Actinomycetota bacterium]